jgi:hypothetical protein
MKMGSGRNFSYAAYPPPLRAEQLASWAYDEHKRIQATLDGILEPAWDDLLGASITLVRPPTDPAAWDETEIANAFVHTSATRLQFSHQFTHRWWEQDPVRPHLHVYQSTTATANLATAVFEMHYKWYNVSDTVPLTFTVVTGTVTFATGSARKSVILQFPEIAATGKKVSSIFKGNIWRVPAVASDTYTATVFLDYQDIHLRIDSRGSYEEYVKVK